jgi:calcineurin-like phosphoesterase
MTGPYGGVIGANLDVVIKRSKYGLSARMEPFEDHGKFNGAIFFFDEKNIVKKIERVNFCSK